MSTEASGKREETWRPPRQKPFDLEQHADVLQAILDELRGAPQLTNEELARVMRRHTLPGGQMLSKSRLLDGYAQLCEREGRAPDPKIVRRLRVKPTRTISGVAPVTVLTEPFPCPGECIFCPSLDQMPKSYLPDEPGAMRAASYEFDPYDQTAGRIGAMSRLGHNVDKIELLILGGTWSSYPEEYQEWFVRRCLDAMNGAKAETLEEAQRLNERAAHRNVGLVVETRPDCITPQEVRRLRWLGATKVQLGVQSLDDEILARNQRGHTVAQTRAAMRLLRLAGFKIAVHWMSNLLGATPESDLADFRRLWDDDASLTALRPDELKIYPTALLVDTELYDLWQRGEYQPYDEETLVELLVQCKRLIPPYCRVNRLMRDIPSPNIVAGVKKTNLRQIVQQRMAREGLVCRCIRCREIRGQEVDSAALELERLDYETGATRECFLSYVTPDDRLAGFLRLSLPQADPSIDELTGCAVVRELHVYGPALKLGVSREGAAQHAGLGTRLLEEARCIARQEDFRRLAVIAAVGTRPYYQERGFEQGELYMVQTLGVSENP
ncbi:MAG: tRNA uridine(34) 5-carboxymethylaminomethyl modification radical SAM/GNAT enzyme Elp3 [Chloroflexota bacterium]|nr:tRNA uridine(34) 5-carboxymethylaminomethyl modification radical SAM/GNAT enzyme Elp3 [Chloroflexota bacterium]